ncbi:hypothetical protein PROFUN_00956 [Planoprotostelium fungivorum]|uniref:Uncharacterized protein n=1 Tax=Planoprotostelium fungivorum TaxID=1890364 RepID=A0A2P6N4C1_9EUKA|nr:hypothetical protein PROFUN_00956 [Planoprotostelium fungivorum]
MSRLIVLCLFYVILSAHAYDNPSVTNTGPLFSGFTALYAEFAGNYQDRVDTTGTSLPLVSPNGQWKLTFSTDLEAHVVHYQDSSVSRWGTVGFANGGSDPTTPNPPATWSSGSNGGRGIPGSFYTIYNVTLSNNGQLIQYNSNTSQILWKSSMISSIDTSYLTTDGGNVTLIGFFYNPLSSGVTSNNRNITIISQTIDTVVARLPAGSGPNSTFTLSDNTSRSALRFLFSYPPPTLSAEIRGQIITVSGQNAGANANLCLSFAAKCQSISGATFRLNLTVPYDLPTSFITVSLQSVGYPKLSSLPLTYKNPLDSIDLKSIPKLFETIEDISFSALTSDTKFIYNSSVGVSIYASKISPNAGDVTGSIENNRTSFSLPASVIRSVSQGNGSTPVSVILCQIPVIPFPVDVQWTTIDRFVGLSLYVDDTHANVTNAASLIEIEITITEDDNITREHECLFWKQMTSSWSREGCSTRVAEKSVTCLCSHLTNFTLGRPVPVSSSQTISELSPASGSAGGYNKMYLIAIAGIVPIILLVVLIAILIARRKKRDNKFSVLSLEPLDDVETKEEIGRGAKSIIYLASKSHTTDVAVKKTKDREKAKQLMTEGNRLKDIHHPNILMHLGLYTEEQMICLVVDYMKHGSLHDLIIRAIKWTNEEILTIMKQIASAVTYLHENSFIHGRLCPRKVYISSTHLVKLSAYGAETVYDTPEYMNKYTAAEVMKNNRLSPEGDVYSFGIIFDEMTQRRQIEDGIKNTIPNSWKDMITSCTESVAENRILMRVAGTRLQHERPQERSRSPPPILNAGPDAYGMAHF